MAGSSGSDDEMVAGRVNRAESMTRMWAQVPSGQTKFNGPAIFVVEVARAPLEDEDYEANETHVPANAFHGLTATGHSGQVGATAVAHGVVGRGGKDQGTGVVGEGGGMPGSEGGAGGIGVHGLGGQVIPGNYPFSSLSAAPPGAGVVGQGGCQDRLWNRDRAPHAAGVIGIAGGTAKGFDALPAHGLSETGGVGVYGKGADLEIEMVTALTPDGTVDPSGGNVPSGPATPGVGVMGRGGAQLAGGETWGAGVIGLAGGEPVGPISPTWSTGVYGRGPVGVKGVGVRGQGAVFETLGHPQLRLVPVDAPQPPNEAQAGDFMVISEVDERGTRIARLWFCTIGGPGVIASWVKLA